MRVEAQELPQIERSRYRNCLHFRCHKSGFTECRTQRYRCSACGKSFVAGVPRNAPLSSSVLASLVSVERSGLGSTSAARLLRLPKPTVDKYYSKIRRLKERLKEQVNC